MLLVFENKMKKYLLKKYLIANYKYFKITFIALILFIIAKYLRKSSNNYKLLRNEVFGTKGLFLGQTDEKLLDFIKSHYIIRPNEPSVEYNLECDGLPLCNQSPGLNKEVLLLQKTVLEILNHKKNGFFVESGANNGEFLSNTLALEKKFGWTGLLIEPDPLPLEILISKNRKAWVSNACLSIESYPQKVIMKRGKFDGHTAIKNSALASRPNEFVNEEFSADCFPLFSILSSIGVHTVDYLSLDIEGAELSVLKTIPFDSISIKIISVEVNKLSVKELGDFMNSKGYWLYSEFRGSFIDDHLYIHQNITKKISF